jgi:hypothetical protein
VTIDNPSILFPPQAVEAFPGHPVEGARRYDRIAGFFSSSLLEVAGEALVRMTPEGGETCVGVVCNYCLDPLDVQTARAAKWGMRRQWWASLPAEIGTPMKVRLQRLYDFLQSGILKVKILPNEAFGLIHGKAGGITRTDGSQVCLVTSIWPQIGTPSRH